MDELGVLDGWHRLQAALRAGVEPVFETVELSVGGALGLIVNRNSRRRHSTTSRSWLQRL